jgi:Arc/MetJ family transcription regulator
MAKTLIDIDDDLLEEATTALGTATKKETVNEALRRVVEQTRETRRQARENLQRLVEEGGFDFSRIDEIDS